MYSKAVDIEIPHWHLVYLNIKISLLRCEVIPMCDRLLRHWLNGGMSEILVIAILTHEAEFRQTHSPCSSELVPYLCSPPTHCSRYVHHGCRWWRTPSPLCGSPLIVLPGSPPLWYVWPSPNPPAATRGGCCSGLKKRRRKDFNVNKFTKIRRTVAQCTVFFITSLGCS